jgi:hypothetical protein
LQHEFITVLPLCKPQYTGLAGGARAPCAPRRACAAAKALARARPAIWGRISPLSNFNDQFSILRTHEVWLAARNRKIAIENLALVIQGFVVCSKFPSSQKEGSTKVRCARHPGRTHYTLAKSSFLCHCCSR